MRRRCYTFLLNKIVAAQTMTAHQTIKLVRLLKVAIKKKNIRISEVDLL